MNINVLSKAGETSFTCEEGETLLFAGLRQGLTLPYECATGTCGTCRARLAGGEVEIPWPDAPAFAKIKREKGDILMCQCRPRGDCDLKIPANVTKSVTDDALPAHRKGIVKAPRRLTHDVMHFEIQLSSPMSFKAGQFVVIEAKDVPGRRAYSMVNYQTGTQTISLVVKRKPGGGFSDWLFEGNIEGEALEVFGPLGQATFQAEEDKDMICIAGGSGIAGMMSILECATSSNYFDNHKGHVFFGVRSPADAFYVEELSRYVAAAKGGLEVTLAFSHQPPASSSDDAFPGLTLAAGMVHEVAAKTMAGRYGDMIGYVAGPTPMVDGAIRVLITEAALARDCIRYDKFA
ncbi:MAG: 2Fe-2S iron-sulfur cluster binding domain-containing protein [Beijerinckiaceae bacterium]|nr:MAG: 2Fe-2S iron-sulfur cluster binding domain-containing protein [Beijerinckiaceae bacterium]